MSKTVNVKKMERVKDRGDLRKVNNSNQDMMKIDREKDRGDLRKINIDQVSGQELELKDLIPDCEQSGRTTNPKSNKHIELPNSKPLKANMVNKQPLQDNEMRQLEARTTNYKSNKHFSVANLNATKSSTVNKNQTQMEHVKDLDASRTPSPKSNNLVENINPKHVKQNMEYKQTQENNIKQFERTKTNLKFNGKSIPKYLKPDSQIKLQTQDVKKNSDSPNKDPENNTTHVHKKTYLDLAGRRQLMERYTVKLKDTQISKKSDVKLHEEIYRNENKPKDESKAKSNDSLTHSKQVCDDTPKGISMGSHRKPIIRTETNEDNRVYKAVTFVDQKHHTPLQIDISNEFKKQKMTDHKVKLKPSRESVKETQAKVKKRVKKKRVLSPELFAKGNASPPTEVAKWVPCCLSPHTAPYYTAWVNTTLTATSKEKNKYLEQNIRSLQRTIREYSPDLVHENYADERYTGRIKVRHRCDPGSVNIPDNCKGSEV